MKAMMTLKSFDAPPSGASRNAGSSVSDNQSSPTPPTTRSVPDPDHQPEESVESFRETLRRRSTTPFTDTIPYRRCGIFE